MGSHGFLKVRITIVAIAVLYGCSPASTPASNEPVSPTGSITPVSPTSTLTPVSTPNTVTPAPRVTPGSPAENAMPLRVFTGHSRRVLDVAFSAQGGYLASSSQDMTIKLWDVHSGQEVQSFRMRSVDMADIDIATSRNLLASAEAIWDLDGMQELHALERGSRYPGSVAFSPDGSELALGLFEQQVTLWDVASGRPVYTFDRQEENRTKSMDFSPDGALLAVGVIDGTVRVLDVRSGGTARILHYPGETDIHSLAFSPDGRYLATGGRISAVILWDVASGEVVRRFRLTDNAISVDFSPDGTLLATAGGREYEARLWDVESGSLLQSMPHSDQLTSVAFAPDGRWLAVGCFDSNVYVWEIP